MIYSIISGLQCKSTNIFFYIHDLIRGKQDSTDNQYYILTVNLQDSNTQKMLRLEIWRDVENETSRDGAKVVETETC